MDKAKIQHPMAPPKEEEMTRVPLGNLEHIHTLAVRLEYPPTGLPCCCTRNGVRYDVLKIPPGTEDRVVSDAEMRRLERRFVILEDASLFCNCWCGFHRCFRLGIFPSNTSKPQNFSNSTPLLVLERPYQPSCWMGKLYCPQKIFIRSNGKMVGFAERECRFWDCFFSCTYWTRVFDADGNPRYTIRSPGCGKRASSFFFSIAHFINGTGDNCCAPSSCKRIYEMDVFRPTNENERVASLKNIWKEELDGSSSAATDTNFVLVFPSDADEHDKSLLLGALFLQDFGGQREQYLFM